MNFNSGILIVPQKVLLSFDNDETSRKQCVQTPHSLSVEALIGRSMDISEMDTVDLTVGIIFIGFNVFLTICILRVCIAQRRLYLMEKKKL